MKYLGKPRRYLLALAMALAIVPNAALAEDSPEEVGLLAALGLSAADGKTTLGAGAGAIEATLLNSDSVNEAGAIIAGLVNHQLDSSTDQRVLVLTRSEIANLANLRMIRSRLRQLALFLAPLTCAQDSNKLNFALESVLSGLPTTVTPSDLTALLATSTTYAAVAVTVDDRLLLNSLMLNAPLSIEPVENGDGPAIWQVPNWHRNAEGAHVDFVIPSESQGSENSSLYRDYDTLLNHVGRLRTCPDKPDVKAALAVVDAYLTGLNAVSADNQVSALARAMQLDTAISIESTTRILRLAVEASGGTTATRSSIWYTLGFPGAATVSAGMLISFRLIEPTTGATTLSGIVRCAERPRNIRSIARIAHDGTEPGRRCTYIAGPQLG
ncbi:MAG TPA: hypothetical protein VK614_10445 [Allosphingosinicella sp.]|nr:hypothetical protein [Allosphingosinicella sp.]